MTTESRYTRRRLLQLTSGTAILGLAGCRGGQTAAGQGEPSPTETHQEEPHDDEHTTESAHIDDESGHDEDAAGHAEEEHGHELVSEPSESAEVAVNTTADGEAHFDPHVSWIEQGGTVTWVLESGSHTATAYHPDNDEPQLVPDGAASWDSGMLSAEGETFEHTFETEGVYHYYCIPHETGGMIASVIVGEPDPHGQPAFQEPPAEKPDQVRAKLAQLNERCNEALGHTH